MKIKIYSLLLFVMLQIILQPAFADKYQTEKMLVNKHFKSLACDDSGQHCFGLSHDPKNKYSLKLYRTDNSGENWSQFASNFYTRIGPNLDSAGGMKIACDQYLQNCLIGVTIFNGQAFVFYGTNDSGQAWKGTVIWQENMYPPKSSYIAQLTCNPSAASKCQLITDSNEIYIIENDQSNSSTTDPDALNIKLRHMSC